MLLVIVAYFFLSKNNNNQQITVKVKKGNFPIEVTTTGELIAKNSDKIFGPQELGQIFRIWNVKIQDIIPDGTVVDSGQYVAQLDPSEITNKIKDEETNQEKLETSLTKTRLDTTLELRALRDDLINLRFGLKEKEITLEQSIYEPPATKAQVKMELERAERTLDQTEKNYKLRYQKAVANMQEVTASYNQGQRKLEQMKDVLGRLKIHAPKAGMVIYKRNWDGSKMGVNAIVNTYDNIVAELPDLSEMISKTYINEIDISKVKVGQEVQIGIDAFPEKKFTGKVTEVANIGEQLQSSNAKVYEVKILLKEYDSILRPAMTTKNKILTNIINNVLFIPIEAIFNNDSVVFVYRRDGGSVKKQQVVVGQSNENEIIILAGIEAEDEILLVPPDKSDNLKIKTLPKEVVAKYKVKSAPVKSKKPGSDKPLGTVPPPPKK